MFKICIAVLLQIIQFSTDENTLKVMKTLDPGNENIETQARIERSIPGAFDKAAKADKHVLLLPFRYKGEVCKLAPGKPFMAMKSKSVGIAL